MALKQKKSSTQKVDTLSIEGIVATHLVTRSIPCTADQCMKELLSVVKTYQGNYKLTIKNIKTALHKWFENGWATVNKNVLKITRAGRARIKAIADAVNAPPAIQDDAVTASA